MEVANIELSKELYDLSGWDSGITTHYRLVKGKPIATNPFDNEPDGETCLYDLGYLLRKLPKKRVKLRNYLRGNTTSWKCQLSIDDGSHTYDMTEEARTPEDAAAKLAVELFKSGQLQKEGE